MKHDTHIEARGAYLYAVCSCGWDAPRYAEREARAAADEHLAETRESATGRTTPTEAHAAGMLEALKTAHSCGEACTATVTLGDGSTRSLRCPLTLLDVEAPADRRIVSSLYAAAWRDAMGVGR